MGKEVRSIRYFDGLFMKAEEFIQEQNYHTRMRRLHNRYLHSSGIVWGLEIQKSKKPGANPADVTVTQGMALNKIEEDGEEVSKEIILTDDTDVSLSSYGAGKAVYIYISYSKEAAPKNSEDSKNIHWLEGGKLERETDRNNIDEDKNVLLGKVSLVAANGTVTVGKIDYVDGSGSLRRYAGFSGKSLQTEKITLAIDGVTSGFASIEGKQTGTSNGLLVNSPITSLSGALSIGDKLSVSGNVQLPDNKSLVLGNTNPVSLHNNSAAPELWLEATGQASSALVIGTAFDPDKQVKVKYAPGAVGAATGELRIGQDVKLAGAFTHGITTLYTNGLERLRIDATGNVIIGTGNLKIPGLDTFLDFGADTRQMINLWGNGPNAAYGIGVQGWTQYYRSSGNFAWYIGGTHSDAELDPGSGGSAAMIIKRGSGNVGIGTANPPQKLSIKGLESSAHGMGAAIGISNAAPGGANWYLRAGATGTSTPESGFSIADDIGYRLVIDKSGNVGIGTNTPSDKLDVEGTVRVNDSNIWLRGGADLNHGIGWYGVGKLFATANIDGPAVFGCSGGALGTACGGQKIALYWNSAGNVGIGTTNPPQKLSISGQESSAHGVGAGIGISNTAPGGANWYLRAGATGTSTPASGFSIADDIGYRLVIDKSGNVGIGTNTPGDKLDVEGTIRVNDNNIWLRGGADINHGIGWYGGTKLFATANIDGPAVFGCSGGALGTVCGGQKIALYWNSAGNVGVGTASPTHKFHVVAADAVGLLESTGTQAYLRLSTSEGLDNRVEITNRSGGRLSLWTAGAGDIFNITRAGNVGIGTISPGSKLTVVGSIAGGETATGWVLGGGAWGPDNWLRITTTQKGSTYHDLAVNKFWAAGAQRFDLAEVTPVKDEDELEQGDVVVIDEENGLRVTRSRKPYDTSVYGIISSYETAAMIIGGAGPETVMRESGKLPIALIGRVKAKVSAEAGAIQVGDLLTTSSTPGHLMKCSNISKGTGAVVGKALEAHESGKGIITVLVTLQ